MRELCQGFFLLILLNLNAYGQCPPGTTLSLNSQADVDDFVTNYSTCTNFNGNIFIGNFVSNDVSDISGLSFLQQAVSLSIWETNLTDLAGLENLSVDNDLAIFRNDLLTDISDLTNLSGELTSGFISQNSTLSSLQGLNNISKFTGDLSVSGNNSSSLDGLNGITEIGGNMSIVGSSTTSLTNLTALSNVTRVGGNILYAELNTGNLGINVDSIFGNLVIINSDLSGFGGMSNLEAILGDFRLTSTSFTDFTGLGNLQYIGDTLEIMDFYPLSFSGISNLDSIKGSFILNPGFGNQFVNLDFTGFNSLDYVGGLEILNVDHNLSFSGLNNLSTMNGNLLISNSRISDGMALNGVTGLIPGYVEFNNIVGLNDFAFLNNISDIGGLLKISNCSPISQISGFTSLVKSAGITLENNPLLSTISGFILDRLTGPALILDNDLSGGLGFFSNVDSIGGSLTLNNCDGLSDLTGLLKLKHVYGSLVITKNDNLQSLDGMDSLVTVVEALEISDNQMLGDISPTISIQFLDELIIENNPLLGECCVVNKLIPAVLNNYSISNNDSGCRTLADIKSNCQAIDPDFDGIISNIDNCPTSYNPNQEDYDSDGVGNPCDNCPVIPNNNQADANNNFIGDTCEMAEQGKIGINVEIPSSGLEIQTSDLFINDESRSIIMKNALGDCYRLYVDLEGELKVRMIDCPNE